MIGQFGQRAKRTRRSVLAGAIGFAVAILPGCGGLFGSDGDSDEPTPTETAPSNGQNESAATSSPTPTPIAPTATDVPRPQSEGEVSSKIQGQFGRALPGFRPSLPREIHIPYAAVVSPKLQVRDLSLTQLEAVWTLATNDWRELGDPVSSPVHRYTLPDTPLPIEPFGGDLQAGSYEELANALWHDRGGLAIIPAWLVDHRVRTLRVDGVDILGSRGAPNPLLLQMFGVPEEVAPESLLPRAPLTKLTFVGDIIFGRFVQVALDRNNDPASSFRSIAGELQKSDLTIGNLECSLSDSFEQPEVIDPQTFRFKTWTKTVAGLELADIDILSRANNHSFDFGPAGMNDTAATLDAAGIQHFGIGQNLQIAREPAIREVNGMTFAFLGYNGISDTWDGATATSAGTSPMREDIVREDVSRAASAGHVVLPFFHWGTEYVAHPTDEQRHFARVAIDAGAAAVIGSHPHWVQAIETYREKPIIYSLGNFVFDQAWSRETTEGLIADIWFEGSVVTGIDLRPILIVDEHRPTLLDEDNAYHVLQRVWNASEGLRG